jgi:uncharacterized membrane protein
MESPAHVLGAIATVSSALIAGVFFAFSTFVMPALNRVSPGTAIRAMQAVNVAVVRPLVMVPLFGTALACPTVLIAAPNAAAGWIGTASVVYAIGVVGVTVFGNVPLNVRLSRVDAGAHEAAAAWWSYSRPWTRLNHIRTVAALSTAVILVRSLV